MLKIKSGPNQAAATASTSFWVLKLVTIRSNAIGSSYNEDRKSLSICLFLQRKQKYSRTNNSNKKGFWNRIP